MPSSKAGDQGLVVPGEDDQYFRRRYGLVVLAVCQNVLAAGIFYGWPSLYTSLLDEGIYSSSCPIQGKVCAEQTIELGLVYTWGSCANLVAQLLWGFVLDNFGPRVCSCLSVLTVMVGICLLGVTSNSFDVLSEAILCVAIGGPGATISCFHISNLFPGSRNSVLSLLSGSFNLGFLVFMIFHDLLARGYSRLYICGAYSCGLLLIALAGLCFWPNASLKAPEGAKTAERASARGAARDEEGALLGKPPSSRAHVAYGDDIVRGYETFQRELDDAAAGKDDDDDDDELRLGGGIYRSESNILTFARNSQREAKRKRTDLWLQVTSSPFLWLAIWMGVGLFWLNFYIGSVADQMFSKSGGDHYNAHLYTNYFTTMLPVGALAIPIFGYGTDKLGVCFAVGLSTVAGIAFSGLTTLGSLQPQVYAFLFYSLYRTFTFATFFQLVASQFGYSSFGVISGLILCIAGLIGLLQYPVRVYGVPHENFTYPNFFMLLMIVVTGCSFTMRLYFSEGCPGGMSKAGGSAAAGTETGLVDDQSPLKRFAPALSRVNEDDLIDRKTSSLVGGDAPDSPEARPFNRSYQELYGDEQS